MEKNVKNLIDYLRKRKQVYRLSIFHSDDRDWNFYYTIIGYLNNNYFHIRISSWEKSYDEVKNEIETVEIVNTTDCKEEIAKILNHFDLLITNKTTN